ncbi:cation:proton antiporter [Candidatus Uhrbacteria bacterium]|nr:cation:proton antiporter [Candidatus Uhrbacteria bacterium]
MTPFTELALAVLTASVIGIILKALRQPLILAYILAGIVLGPIGFRVIQSEGVLVTLSTLGIAFLLFLIGLELDLKKLNTMRVSAIIVGVGQIIFTALIGFGLVRLFGIALLPSLYIALALTFSSTVVVVKLLSVKQDLDAWYARLTIAMLLVQDLVAIILLILLAGLGDPSASPLNLTLSLLWFLLKGCLLLASALLFAQTILRPLFLRFARSQELLLIGSIAWCFLGALLADIAGFSIAIGAFFAGLAIAQLPYHLEIASRVRVLRDFFLVLFFVALGAQLAPVTSINQLIPALLLSLFVLVGNPLIVLALMGVLGYRKRIGFFVGLAMAQISEFSLLLMALGKQVGHVRTEDVLLVTTVGIITIPLSSYFMLHSETLYRWFSPFLGLFERRKPKHDIRQLPEIPLTDHAVLFGYHRMGTIIARSLDRLRVPSLIVDFNPDAARMAVAEGRPCVYGDVSDPELLADLNLERARMIISTVPDYEETEMLIRTVRERARRVPIYVTALSTPDALALYETGADYVIFPHALSAFHFSALLRTSRLDRRPWTLERKQHIETLQQMITKELPY